MGIKGVGMATLAVMAKEAGFVVGGSDIDEEFITDKILKESKIDISLGFRSDNVKDFFGSTPKEECLFIFTGAHNGVENPETQFAREASYKCISHGEAVGLFMSGELFGRADMQGVSVAGSHGKTTISSLLAFMLAKLGLDPSYTVGTSEIMGLGAAGHYGKGSMFVAEADEYMAGEHDKVAKFLYQKPNFLILNNVDFDHPDFYSDLDQVSKTFSEFVGNILSSGSLIANGDDEEVKKIINAHRDVNTITYGTSETNDFIIKNYTQEELTGKFDVIAHGTLLGNFSISLPGYYNAKNSLAVIALLMEIGISPANIQKLLPEFKGSKRRLERVGQTKNGAFIFDDYAHHPEEIRKTLGALKSAYDKKIICVFQAHTYSRTQSLLSEFASSFTTIAELIILPTFSSARHAGQQDLEGDREFVEKIRSMQPNVKLIENKSDVVEYIGKNVPSSEFLVITMGAGDVYKVGYELAS